MNLSQRHIERATRLAMIAGKLRRVIGTNEKIKKDVRRATEDNVETDMWLDQRFNI